MTSRERVFDAINNKKTDRVPTNYTAHTSMTEKLISHLGVKDEDELLDALNVDMRRVPCVVNQPNTGPDCDGYYSNMWGLKSKDPLIINFAKDNVYPFNEDSSLDDVYSHNWPDASLLDLSYVYDECGKYLDKYAIFGSPWCEFFHTIGWMIGQEDYFILMTERPELIDAITTHVVDYYVDATDRFLKAAGGRIDITYFGNDFGTQRSLFISPTHWNRFIRPSYKRLVDVSKSYNCKVMLHTCGAVRELIPIFIEMGVDIIDPIQVTATGMDFDSVYNDFSAEICLHGAVDMQRTLPLGSVQDVRDEVKSRIKTVGKNAGYILAPSQELLETVPFDNVLAMYETAYEQKM